MLNLNEMPLMRTRIEAPTGEVTESPIEDILLTKQELVTKLKKTPRCIGLWMRHHHFPYIKVGRSVYFRWKDVLVSLDRFRVN